MKYYLITILIIILNVTYLNAQTPSIHNIVFNNDCMTSIIALSDSNTQENMFYIDYEYNCNAHITLLNNKQYLFECFDDKKTLTISGFFKQTTVKGKETIMKMYDDDLEVADYYPMNCYEVVKDSTWIFYKNNQVIKKEEYDLGTFIK